MKTKLSSIILVVVMASAAMGLVIPAGSTTKKVPFTAYQSADPDAAFTGGTTWTVYYSIDGGSDTAMTTPTVSEIDSTNMPGSYWLLVDESAMTAIPDAYDTAILLLTVKHADMVTLTFPVEIREPMSTIAEVQSGIATSVTASAIKAVTDKLDVMIEAYGESGYQFTDDALEGILGILPLEEGTGYIQAVLYDVDDEAPLLVAQDLRDAMNLSPTAGTSIEGSIDDILMKIFMNIP